MDDFSVNYHVYNNLCIGVGTQNRSGAYHIIENNIFINPQNLISYHVGCENNQHKFVKNIVVVSDKFENFTDFRSNRWGNSIYQVQYAPVRSPWIEQCDFNVFFTDNRRFSAYVRLTRESGAELYSLEKWRECGYDRHSIIADPMFIDAANGDYRVKPESPAIEFGFKNFDMDKFGLLPDFPDKWED